MRPRTTGAEIAGSLNALEASDIALVNATVSGVVAALGAIEPSEDPQRSLPRCRQYLAPSVRWLLPRRGRDYNLGLSACNNFSYPYSDRERAYILVSGQLELPPAPVDIVGPMSFGCKQRYLLGPWQVPVRW